MKNKLLITNWYLSKTQANLCASPAELSAKKLSVGAVEAATVAAALKKQTDGYSDLADLDHFDWWFETEIDGSDESTASFLQFDGLATLAEVWMNGELLASSFNMFLPLAIAIGNKLKNKNTLQVVFRSNQFMLAQKRPRPAWKTKLVENQNLRWLRTSLLGYIPAWTPDIKPIGFWKPVSLNTLAQQIADGLFVKALVCDGGNKLQLSAKVKAPKNNLMRLPKLRCVVGDANIEIKIEKNSGDELVVDQSIDMGEVDFWWPHTHGEPTLYTWSINDVENRAPLRSGHVGFKSVELLGSNSSISVVVNEEKVFCRGACWTTSDIVALGETEEALRQALTAFKNSNMNMLRVGGTMLYEHDIFYALCDELGIMIWQDFMFANMDYPVEDSNFSDSIREEVSYQIQRLAQYVCVSVYCGNSEVEQQAAMMGVAQGAWRNRFFGDTLPSLCAKLHKGIPYFPSSPCEGALPFYSSTGIAHYFGVGAYQRDLSDLEMSKVKFTSECLGFSNIPSEVALLKHFSSAFPPTHTPAWKSGVPRDNVAGWDFEDIRDFYTKKLFALDPVSLRYENTEKYFELSRITSGYIMARSFVFWRSSLSHCAGALTWFYKDLVPGAGWGLLDSDGGVKPAIQIVQQVLNTHQCYVIDRGLEGHLVGAINESRVSVRYKLKILLLSGNKVTLQIEKDLELNAGEEQAWLLSEILGYFIDSNNSYRFSAEKIEAVAAILFDEKGHVLSQDLNFVKTIPLSPLVVEENVTLDLSIKEGLGKELGGRITIESNCFLAFANFQFKALSLDKNYLHILPGIEYQLEFNSVKGGNSRVRGYISALNLQGEVRVSLNGLAPYSITNFSNGD